MRFVALFLIVTLVAADIQDEFDALETLRNESPFKSNVRYTYAYETLMRVFNPVVPEQYVGMKLQAFVHLRFVPVSAVFYKVQMTISDAAFNSVESNPHLNKQPLETFVPSVDDLKQHLPREIFFDYFNGKVLRIFYQPSEHMWSVNIKRGIISMLSVNFLGTDKRSGGNSMFNKLEKTIHGICDCTYTMDDTKQFINVSKTIDVTSCRSSLNQVYSTINHRLNNIRNDSPVKSLTMMNFELLKTKSNFKVIRCNSTGTTMFYPLGESKEPISSMTNQTLRLVKEKGLPRNRITIPKWKARDLMFQDPKQTQIQSRLSASELTELKKLVYDTLVKLSYKMEDVSVPFTKESATKVMELVHMLRPLNYNQLSSIWEKCIEQNVDPKISSMFIRIFSLIKTKDSMELFLNKMKTPSSSVSKGLIKEYLFMLSIPQNVERPMVLHIKNMCELDIIQNEKELQQTCLLAAVTLRKVFCYRRYCKNLRLPKELIRILQIPNFVSLNNEEMLKYIIIAESANEPGFIPILMNIVKNKDLPLHIRSRAILALKPLVPKMRTMITNPLFRMFRQKDLPEELRLSIFNILMERPSPSIIHACVHHMILEKSMTIRRFVYDTLMAMTTNHLPVPPKTMRAVRTAIDFIRSRRFVPTNMRWFSQHYVKVFKPFKNSNITFILKNQIHYSNKTLVPRHLFSSLDIKIFGQYLNLVDFELKAEGVQEFLNKMIGIVQKNENDKENDKVSSDDTEYENEKLKIFTTLKMFGRQWMSLYKTIQDKKEDELVNKILPKKYLLWKNLAQSINDGMKFQTSKTFMPVDVIARIPTCSGIPLVYNLTTVVMHQMESFMQTKTPNLLDIPYFFFTTKTVKAEAIYKQRTMLLVRGSLYFENPLITVGLYHNKTLNMTFNTRFNMRANIETMKYDTDVELPKLPEILTAEAETELFIRRQKTRKEVTYKRIPTRLNHILSRLQIFNATMRPEEMNSTVYFKINQDRRSVRYLSESNGRVVVSRSPKKWIVIPCSENNRIISMFIPKLGYLKINQRTQELEFSKTERSYFYVTYTPKGKMSMKTLVYTKMREIPDNVTSHVEEVMEFVNLLRKEGIVIKEMQRVYKMVNEDFLTNAVSIMHFTVLDQTVEMNQIEPTPSITMETLKSESGYEQIKRAINRRRLCLGEWMPLCVHGIVPNTTRMNTDSLFTPMYMKVVTPTEIKKLFLNFFTIVKDDRSEFTFKVGFVGPNPQRSIQFKMDHDKTNRKLDITIRHFVREAPKHYLMCFYGNYPHDSLKAVVSFAPDCTAKHFEIYTKHNELTPRMRPRYSLDFNWIVRMDVLPTFTRDTLEFFYKSIFRPYFHIPFYQDQQSRGQSRDNTDYTSMEYIESQNNKKSRDRNSRDAKYLRITNGTIRVYLPTPTKAQVSLKTPKRLFLYKLNLPVTFESFPVGSEQLSLGTQLFNELQKPVCVHRMNTFKTFDQVEYNFNLPNEKCEHILLQNCSRYVPRFIVTVKERKSMRVVGIDLGESEIRIIPRRFDMIPEFRVDGREITVSKRTTRMTLPNNMNLEVFWVPEDKVLFVRNSELGLEVRLEASRAVYTRISPMLFGKVCGMCGDMNTEKSFEFQTPEKYVVRDPNVFAMSWMIPAKKCSSRECPVERKFDMKVYVGIGNRKQCRPLINLPICFEKCRPTKTIRLNDVPVKCQGNDDSVIMTSVDVPTDCNCPC